jgi:hypothetical protein
MVNMQVRPESNLPIHNNHCIFNLTRYHEFGSLFAHLHVFQQDGVSDECEGMVNAPTAHRFSNNLREDAASSVEKKGRAVVYNCRVLWNVQDARSIRCHVPLDCRLVGREDILNTVQHRRVRAETQALRASKRSLVEDFLDAAVAWCIIHNDHHVAQRSSSGLIAEHGKHIVISSPVIKRTKAPFVILNPFARNRRDDVDVASLACRVEVHSTCARLAPAVDPAHPDIEVGFIQVQYLLLGSDILEELDGKLLSLELVFGDVAVIVVSVCFLDREAATIKV